MLAIIVSRRSPLNSRERKRPEPLAFHFGSVVEVLKREPAFRLLNRRANRLGHNASERVVHCVPFRLIAGQISHKPTMWLAWCSVVNFRVARQSERQVISAKAISMSVGLFRQGVALLLAHQIFGVPIRPIWIRLSRSLFMFSRLRRRPPQGLGKIVRRRIGRVSGNAPRAARCNLLELPAVAIRIAE